MLKSNRPGPRAAVEPLFQEPPWGETFPEARQERRWLRTSTARQGRLDWPEAPPVCCLERA